MNSIELTVYIDSNGVPKIHQKHDFEAFCKRNKNKKAMMKLEFLDGDTSAMMQGYYYNYIVPTFRRLFYENDNEIMTLQQVDEQLRKECPALIKEKAVKIEGGFIVDIIMSAYDADTKSMTLFIEFLKRKAATQYGYFIEDPKIQSLT